MSTIGRSGVAGVPRLVNKQFNSPIKLYSDENVTEVINKHVQVLDNGAVGIDFRTLAAPNLANSAVLRMLQEEERAGTQKGLKRVTWPPPPEEQELIFNEQPVYSKGPEGISPGNPGQPQSAWSPPAVATPHNYQPSPQKQTPVQAQVYQPAHFEPPPATVVLRPEAPISQPPPPVFTSQPAATKGVSGRMRGDEKWPPESYKVQAQAENEARLALARGPAFRPRRVKKDYTAFFAQNALNPTYPGYRAPPGTQHYIEEGTSNL
ncbi:uncharacterized protein LOC124722631 isoform X1 [Schistocerca piceifrons]|uniref:uncharacterized protein LOC124722631 isoform X1 n=1 Tax=Schistocerca piceifrons TaxID=274613 RepID=UPI001F5F75C7|nr:uncharacterized protein LOC124722631 isoform X1 [Schistocerca piceifrons]